MIIFAFLMKLLSALLIHITDCDEVFNYWEPLHYLQYGYGLQTWEYSPAYSIRSYFYLLIHSSITWLLGHISKVWAFYGLRIALSLTSLCTEYFLFRSVRKIHPPLAKHYWIISSLCPGLFVSSSSFLPSAFSSYLITLAVAASLENEDTRCLYWVAAAALIGWPFVGILVFPLILPNSINQLWKIVRHGILITCAISVPIAVTDWYFYGKWQWTPLNIVLYNVFSSHGPNLYGTEPWWFYFTNLLLNFNVMFVMALALLPLLFIHLFSTNRFPFRPKISTKILCKVTGCIITWLAIFSKQPHKEERFMFVIYPLICLTAAMGLVYLESWIRNISLLFKHDKRNYQLLLNALYAFYAILSLSRIAGLFYHYHAPMTIFRYLDHVEPGTVCMGKEWHRFPSHYLMPKGMRLGFLESEFNGLLPKYFAELDRIYEGTSQIPLGMNDVNRKEDDRYVSVAECDYLVDVSFGRSTPKEPDYVSLYSTIICIPYLDAYKTTQFNRILFLPFQRKEWGQYCLLKVNKIG